MPLFIFQILSRKISGRIIFASKFESKNIFESFLNMDPAFCVFTRESICSEDKLDCYGFEITVRFLYER